MNYILYLELLALQHFTVIEYATLVCIFIVKALVENSVF